jgi:hypothetical protein
MRTVQLLLAAAAGAGALAALLWWYAPAAPLPSQSPPPSAAAVPPPTAPPPPEAAAPEPAAPSEPEEPPSLEEAQEATPSSGDLLLYDEKPMSKVPHRVARGWGATGERRAAGLVGAYVVVEPSISDAQLLDLARDILAYHGGAKIVAMRVFDDEEAATYDRHVDGGVLAEKHLVARIARDPVRGVLQVYVRGKWIDP